jgi:uncharacterized protein (DUF362 family)
MRKYPVSIVKYEKPYESVKKAIDLCDGLKHMPANANVFIKPNIVFWTRNCEFPKWVVITTSKVIEDIVEILAEHGVGRITIGEGIVADPKDKLTPAHAFEALGYEKLRKKYGVRLINIMERPFEKVSLTKDITLKFNTDIINSDFVVNVPVMKTHNQTIVSLGIKNLKGTIDIPSRKKSHNPDLKKNLDFHLARLGDRMPPMLVLADGIYTSERGPSFDGKIHRSNLLVASSDFLAADFVACSVLGHDPATVPYLAYAAKNHSRPTDLSDIEIYGEKLKKVARLHEFDFVYVSDDLREVPLPLAKKGIKGLFYRKFDNSMCTYCAGFNGLLLTAIAKGWKGNGLKKTEVLTGKVMEPAAGMDATILVGQCMYKKNKNHPNIQKMIPIRGCPPDPNDAEEALRQAGFDVDPQFFSQAESLPCLFMSKYKDRPEFERSFFEIH